MSDSIRNRTVIRGALSPVRRPARAAAAVLLGAALLASGAAQAQHHRGPRVSIGIHFGAPHHGPHHWPHHWPHRLTYVQPAYVYPAYVYPPYYYHPPVVTVPAAPPVYVERGDGSSDAPPTAGAPSSDWYYCSESRMYYPYARECTGGWQRVPARPVR